MQTAWGSPWPTGRNHRKPACFSWVTGSCELAPVGAGVLEPATQDNPREEGVVGKRQQGMVPEELCSGQ